MEASIRTATMDDAEAVARLTAQLGYELSSSEASGRLSRIVARADQQFLVAALEGEVVGWVHVAVAEFVETGRFAIIGGLVVDRDRRRQGIGRLLMDRAEQWALGQECPVIRLWSSAARADAHRFYEGMGYTNVKTQYSFVKPLSPAGQERVAAFVPRVDRS
jgi:GNAT superfamily N-acetyltransferase